MQIILIYYLLSVIITFTALYLYSSEPQIILKYPNIDKKISDLYVDDKGTCYRYKTKEIDCNLVNK